MATLGIGVGGWVQVLYTRDRGGWVGTSTLGGWVQVLWVGGYKYSGKMTSFQLMNLEPIELMYIIRSLDNSWNEDGVHPLSNPN